MSDEIFVGPADLDDWTGLNEVRDRLEASKFSAYVSATRDELRALLCNSILLPHAVGLLVARYRTIACGMAALLLVQAPRPGTPGVATKPHGFIHSVYIDPSVAGMMIPPAVGAAVFAGIEKWSRDRGADYVYGNVRLDGHFDALYRKYGLVKQHYVIGKEL